MSNFPRLWSVYGALTNEATYLHDVEYLLIALMGLGTAALGITLPGMVNMTAVSVCIKRGQRPAMIFIAGAAFVTALQAGTALFFADVLQRNEGWLTFMKQAGVWIFVILSTVFFLRGRDPKVAKAKKSRGGRYFGFGAGLTTANFLAIPFFLAVSAWLLSHGRATQGLFKVIFFGLGAGAGSFLIFWGYVQSANWVAHHASWLTRNINFIMSGLFLFLAGLQAWQLYG